MEGNKNKVLLTVIGAGTLLVALAGATFAYFSATATTTTQQVTTSSMDLTVTKDEESTHVTDIKPTTWESAETAINNEDIAKVRFGVTSSSSTAGTYSIDMSAANLKLNEGNDAAGKPLSGGSLEQVMYKVYKVTDGTYTAVSGAAASGNLASLEDDGDITPIEIISGAAISGTLNDQYVIFVYIENDEDGAQNQLQGLDFTISVTGSASQAQ